MTKTAEPGARHLGPARPVGHEAAHALPEAGKGDHGDPVTAFEAVSAAFRHAHAAPTETTRSAPTLSPVVDAAEPGWRIAIADAPHLGVNRRARMTVMSRGRAGPPRSSRRSTAPSGLSGLSGTHTRPRPSPAETTPSTPTSNPVVDAAEPGWRIAIEECAL
eukprot:CAMPEP_0180005504 /NCGR_PEP_ID=MMETSP0984-20121128/12734_1 /TAXON_ID=483367 /ORGANISM="non described non described, Strain CCMP 2436" /LENGTH=161 /DNA_ID=CAMNT_0021926227 /DNA_START=108 /DNA_END=595 /DNA_ORIENTATION=+